MRSVLVSAELALVCPYCSAQNTIAEVERAHRYNTVHEADRRPDGSLAVQVSIGTADYFRHLEHICTKCGAKVGWPPRGEKNIEINYTE
jgi:hypothetical protein